LRDEAGKAGGSREDRIVLLRTGTLERISDLINESVKSKMMMEHALAMPNNHENVTELNRSESTTVTLRLLELMRDLEILGAELLVADEAIGQTYQDPLTDRLSRVGVSNQKVEDFIAWRQTISGLISNNARDEDHLAKIAVAEAAGLALLAELIAHLRKRNQQRRAANVLTGAIAA
jgi:hypothetical protein